MSAINAVSAGSSSFTKETKKKMPCLTSCFWNAIHMFTAIATEFYSMVYSAVVKSKGNTKKFHYYDLNPTFLTKKQAQQPATLILHGLYHNQTGALQIAKELQKNHIGPVFTINLKYNTKNPKIHHKVLRVKLRKMRKLYNANGQPMRLNVIGHSYGTKTAIELLKRPLKSVFIEKIISVAGRIRADKSCHHSLRKDIKKVEKIIKQHPDVGLYHLVAAKDYLLSSYAASYSKNTHIVKNRSHLGILYAKESHKKIVEFLTF